MLGVDLGKARIGLAVMNLQAGIPTPLPAVQAKGALAKDAEQVAAVAQAQEAGTIVLGLPLLMGEETPMSRVVRRFGAILEDHGVCVAYADESMTTSEADTALFEAGMKASQRKKARDSEAACRILERFREQNDANS
ncbi:Holliday junction resolvase RuvX [Kamptonema cortianum]|nr:Holliday junction resolvase RuvX [Geitlerinema splendidum]MDK3157726.1 Holliday junction resolvase RuvX [Kamptonema cortianum]